MIAEKPPVEAELPLESLPPTLSAPRTGQWLKDNKPSLDAYNVFIAKHGVFSDGLRYF